MHLNVKISLHFLAWRLMMRLVQNPQLTFGQVDISKIQFDYKSRDDIPQILRGLQYIYINRDLREKISKLLEEKILPKTNKKNGRPGLELWKILVLGVLRLDLNLKKKLFLNY